MSALFLREARPRGAAAVEQRAVEVAADAATHAGKRLGRAEVGRRRGGWNRCRGRGRDRRWRGRGAVRGCGGGAARARPALAGDTVVVGVEDVGVLRGTPMCDV